MNKKSKCKKRGLLCPSWDDLPSDVLLLLFEKMPTSSLAVCLFVSQTWRNHVEHVMEVQNKWGELLNTTEFKLKCNESFSCREMFYNYILWHNFQKATIRLHQELEINGIKKINIYRGHLIVVTDDIVEYYNAKTLNTQAIMRLTPCEIFYENDYMAVEVFQVDKYLRLQLLLKLDSTVIYMAESECLTLTVDNVICYKVYNNECHVLDYRNVYFVYTVDGAEWCKKIVCRYYGNPDDSFAINVFENHVYIMLRCGFVLWIDQYNSQFQKMKQVTLTKSSRVHGRNTPPINEISEDMNRKMFVWCCMDNVKAKNPSQPADGRNTVNAVNTVLLWARDSKIRIEDKAFSNPMKESMAFSYQDRNVTCILQHCDMLILGHYDGKVEFISSRDLSKDFSSTKPMRSFNIKYFKADIIETAVLSIDILEEEGIQHMFIATKTHILHLHITYANSENYMWNKQAFESSIMFTRNW